MEKVAVVTGAGRGIGEEIARRLADRGYAVLVTDVNVEAAGQTAGRLGAKAWAMGLDVRNAEDHRAAASAAAERGTVAVWVNNAGVARAAKAWELPDEEIDLMVRANLLGVIWGSRAAVEVMARGGEEGDIINIASLAGLSPVPGMSAYAATKHGVVGFTTSLQGDLDHSGIPIRAHAVCPAAADTAMVRDEADSPEAGILFSGPRLLEAGEVADRALALLGTRRIVTMLPVSTGLLTRVVAPFPRLGLRVLRLLRWLGELQRRRRYSGI